MVERAIRTPLKKGSKQLNVKLQTGSLRIQLTYGGRWRATNSGGEDKIKTPKKRKQTTKCETPNKKPKNPTHLLREMEGDDSGREDKIKTPKKRKQTTKCETPKKKPKNPTSQKPRSVKPKVNMIVVL